MRRREFLQSAATAAAGLALGAHCSGAASASTTKKAQIAITLDLEMARNFPKWTDTHWDYEKGNLNEPAKRYTVEACRRVKVTRRTNSYICRRPGVRTRKHRLAQRDRCRGAPDWQSHVRSRLLAGSEP